MAGLRSTFLRLHIRGVCVDCGLSDCVSCFPRARDLFKDPQSLRGWVVLGTLALLDRGVMVEELPTLLICLLSFLLWLLDWGWELVDCFFLSTIVLGIRDNLWARLRSERSVFFLFQWVWSSLFLFLFVLLVCVKCYLDVCKRSLDFLSYWRIGLLRTLLRQ